MGAIYADVLSSVQMSQVTTVVGHFHKSCLGSGPTAGACRSTCTDKDGDSKIRERIQILENLENQDCMGIQHQNAGK